MKLNVGLQIYTLRDEMKLGYDEVLKRVSEIGYQGIEMTYDPKSGEEVGILLKKYSLTAIGAHIGLNEIENNYETVITFAKQIGTKTIIIPWVGENEINTIEKAAAYAQRMEKCAEKLEKDGFALVFHNHTAEYTDRFDGKNVTDIFYENSSLVKFEMDIGWAFAAGADVIKYINKLSDRLAFVHIKDIDDKNTPTEIGSGRVNMKEALEAAYSAGVRWGAVEQDACINYPPFESIKVSLDYIKTII